MKNIKQTIKLRANMLSPFDVPPELVPQYDEYINAEYAPMAADATDEQKTYRKNTNANLHAALVNQLKKLPGYDGLTKIGASLPSDQVGLTMQLGGLLFDLWIASSPAPASPLGQHAHTKRAQDLAARMDKDDLVTTSDERAKMAATLNDEELWLPSKEDGTSKKAGFTAWVEKTNDKGESEKIYMTITSLGARAFHQLINEAVMAVSEEVVAAAKKEA